ncbi:MAG: YcxB family protein [Oscillospiraceae bacterium]|jgi:hypothetical protein|nr:YcxB family protein [Oscillospiraceae bacterium]
MFTENQNLLEISAQVDYPAFRRYYYYASTRHLFPWAQWVLILLAAPIYDIVFTVIYTTAGQPLPVRLWVMWALTALGWGYLLLEPRLAYRRRTEEYGANHCSYTFGEEALFCRSPQDIVDEVPYERLTQAVETPTAFYLHAADKSCYLLPKHDVAPALLDDLRDLLKQKAGERYIKKERLF